MMPTPATQPPRVMQRREAPRHRFRAKTSHLNRRPASAQGADEPDPERDQLPNAFVESYCVHGSSSEGEF